MSEAHIDIQKGLRAALDNLQSYVYIKDRESRYIYANKLTLELFGCSADDLYLTSDEQYFPADVAAKLKEVDQRVLGGESTEEEIIVDDESGKRVYLEAKTPLYSDSEADKIIGILGISTDITYQKSLEEQALKLAKTDVLTGLSNRLEIDSVLSGEIERLKRFPRAFSIIMLDIDHFKRVNDHYGHIAGDHCLQQIASILKLNSRSIDTVGRWGGEEFLIICPETDLKGTEKLAEKLRTKIAEHDFSQVGKITCSFGVTSFFAGDTLESIVDRADQALYQAKDAGRNKVMTLD